jgi:hypothetical protein
VSYSVVRGQGIEETVTSQLEAESAVRLLKDWARVYPQQLLVIRDDAGLAVAYRLPGTRPLTAA